MHYHTVLKPGKFSVMFHSHRIKGYRPTYAPFPNYEWTLFGNELRPKHIPVSAALNNFKYHSPG
jgi:hypothetical protein